MGDEEKVVKIEDLIYGCATIMAWLAYLYRFLQLFSVIYIFEWILNPQFFKRRQNWNLIKTCGSQTTKQGLCELEVK